MDRGLHAVGWGLQRLGITLGVLVIAALLAYTTWVVVIVIGQAITGWAQ